MHETYVVRRKDRVVKKYNLQQLYIFMEKSISHFIIVDDDHINQALSRMLIKLANERADIKAFTFPAEAFKYISGKNTKNVSGTCSIVLLDLNMPVMNGWEFLERFEQLDEKIKNQFKIYIHTSSSDPRDKDRASADKNVVDYIVKPLTREVILKLLSPCT
jgi:CheY-like chemotaxis protein